MKKTIREWVAWGLVVAAAILLIIGIIRILYLGL